VKRSSYPSIERLFSLRTVVAILLAGAAGAAFMRGASEGFLGRSAGVLAAAAMLAVAIAVLREQDWGWGAAFFLGICWLWAAVALRVQDVLQPGEFAMWLAWSVGVIVASVRGRSP
jgi:hypothetical protein